MFLVDFTRKICFIAYLLAKLEIIFLKTMNNLLNSGELNLKRIRSIFRCFFQPFVSVNQCYRVSLVIVLNKFFPQCFF